MRPAILILCLIIANAALADSVNIVLPALTGDYDSQFACGDVGFERGRVDVL